MSPLAALRTILFIGSTVVATAYAAPSQALAFKIGDWEAVCEAVNTRTKEIQKVTVRQVSRIPFPPWYARTIRHEDGTWEIQFNILALRTHGVPDSVKKFFFYHECAHARLNEASERIADCEGLRQMRKEMVVSDQLMKDIAHSYLLIGRKFPTGGPCDNSQK